MRVRPWILKPVLKTLTDVFAAVLAAILQVSDRIRDLIATQEAEDRAAEQRLHAALSMQHTEMIRRMEAMLSHQTVAYSRLDVTLRDLTAQIQRMEDAARFYCNMKEYEAVQFAVDKVKRDGEFLEKSTQGEKWEETGKWAAAYLAEHGIRDVNGNMLNSLVRAAWGATHT